MSDLNGFFSKLNELMEKDKKGETIELDEQIDFLLSIGTTGEDSDMELKEKSQRLKNRRENLNKLLND